MFQNALGRADPLAAARAVAEPLKVTLVDPSLFTAPYDSGLHGGLSANGLDAAWMVRPLRPGEAGELPPDASIASFYRSVERARWIPVRMRGPAKGVSHVVGLFRLIRHAVQHRPAVIHFQWTMVPLFDWLAMMMLKLIGIPVVLTVHDANPFNGERMTLPQKLGFHLPIAAADRVIVHTQAALSTLTKLGVGRGKIAVIPHGPLPLPSLPANIDKAAGDHPITFVMFGHIKAYKGVDLMIEAVARLTREERSRMRVIVAGTAHMDMAPLIARADALGIRGAIDFRIGRLSEEEMALLFAETDVFLFPYRVIDASGVYYMVRALGRWMIASRVGVFAEDFVEDEDGRLIPPEDVNALAAAMAEAIGRPRSSAKMPQGRSWYEIGHATRQLYAEVIRN